MFAPNPVVMPNKFGDVAVAAEEVCKDAEQMRRDIYAMSDKYSITQLASMGKDELSDILRVLEREF